MPKYDEAFAIRGKVQEAARIVQRAAQDAGMVASSSGPGAWVVTEAPRPLVMTYPATIQVTIGGGSESVSVSL